MKTGTPYILDGKIPLSKALPFGLQHILCMFVANVTPIILLANITGLENGISVALVQNAMIIAGIGTLVQLFPCWKIGARLPIVMGISFTFLSVAVSIAATHGMGTLMGAVIVGGIIEGLLGLFAKYWIRIIPPIVSATVVTAIGFSLLPIGANSFAGGQGVADFGSLDNWIIGSVTLLSCLFCQIFGKGFLRSISVLVGLVVGYVLSLCMGAVDLSGIHQTDFVAIPKILPFKPEFHFGSILSVLTIFIVSATETIGDTSALVAAALGRNTSTREISGSIACDGFVSSLSGVFGCTPITSFSQNIGLVAMTKVVNRYSIATGAVLMIVAGIFPFIGFLLTSIPQAVLGGCTILIFGTIVYAGLGMVAKCGSTSRNLIIVCMSLSVGLGFTQASDIFSIFPQIIQDIFGENCVATVFLLAVILNLIIPKDLTYFEQ